MTRLHGVLVVVAAVLAVAAEDRKEEAVKEEMKKLEGSWQLVSAERDGEKTPEATARALRTVVTGDRVITFAGDTRLAVSSFKIDPTQKPKTMDLTAASGADKGKTTPAIYELDGDTLRICNVPPGKERPREFDAKKGTGQMLAVYKRVKP